MYMYLWVCDNVHTCMDTCACMCSSTHSCGCMADGGDAMAAFWSIIIIIISTVCTLASTVYTQILVHGIPDATNHLREFALSSLGLAKGKLFAPHVSECIDASTESHIYQV